MQNFHHLEIEKQLLNITFNPYFLNEIQSLKADSEKTLERYHVFRMTTVC